MSELYSLPFLPVQHAAPVGAVLPVPNNALRSSELGEGVDSPKRENYAKSAVEQVNTAIAGARSETDILNREKEELAKMLAKERKERAKEVKKLEAALKKLDLFKKKLGKVVCDMPSEE